MLRNENLRLKNEKNDLIKRTNNLSYILADLQGKTKNAEQERDSMITAMRLLVAESNAAIEKSQSPNHNHGTEQSRPNGAGECSTELQTRDIVNPNIQISNRFSALSTDRKDQNNTGESTSQDASKMTGKKKKRKSKSKRKETTSNSVEHQSEPLARDRE